MVRTIALGKALGRFQHSMMEIGSSRGSKSEMTQKGFERFISMISELAAARAIESQLLKMLAIPEMDRAFSRDTEQLAAEIAAEVIRTSDAIMKGKP